MKVIIVTGLSGAGKSIALNKLEDMGYFRVDNIPLLLMGELLNVLLKGLPEPQNVALGIDSRTELDSDELQKTLAKCKSDGLDISLMYLDASDDTLMRRFSQTRRVHPMARDGFINNGIIKERLQMSGIEEFSDYVINTTELSPAQLGMRIEDVLLAGKRQTTVLVRSFGYKRDIPPDSDIVFDVRFIPNPFWVETLRPLSGLDAPVADYVMSFDQTQSFLNDYEALIMGLLPLYTKEGKYSLNVSFGCTGGRHRSVCVAQEFYTRLLKRGVAARILHRDIDKDK